MSRVTDGFFRVFAAQPSTGRLFTRDEVRDGAAGAAVVSDRYARQQFGDPGAGGRADTAAVQPVSSHRRRAGASLQLPSGH